VARLFLSLILGFWGVDAGGECGGEAGAVTFLALSAPACDTTNS